MYCYCNFNIGSIFILYSQMKKQVYINKTLPILCFIYIYTKGGHTMTMEWGDGAVEEGRGAGDSKASKASVLHA